MVCRNENNLKEFKDFLNQNELKLKEYNSEFYTSGSFLVEDPDKNIICFGVLKDNSSPLLNGIHAPLQHLTFASEDVVSFENFYKNKLGFQVTDRVVKDNGELTTCFTTSNHEHHTIACFKSSKKGMDHHSYEAGDWNYIKRWCDHFASNNIKFYSNSIDIISEEFALKKNIKSTISSKEQEVSFSKRFEFKDLRFRYKDSEKIILDNINIEIKKGESIGIVGKSGAGKSTLIDLIVGILKPTTGTIIIDDKEYNSVPHNFKNQVSYISQDVFLFDGSIADNITMSNFNYTNNEKNKIIQSLKSADLYDMINKLPDGIDTMVGENGINLSGGQRQRIAIARALFRESKLLILDEATSNLDNVTEKKIMNSINTLKGKITMIIISHRLSILDCCDFIYEIKNNKLKKANYEQSNISR